MNALERRLEKVQLVLAPLPEHFIRLIVVFLMQTLIVPLLLLWLIMRATTALLVTSWHGRG
ncbi:MAG: hypothetical protein IPL06_03480 [Betaproteobacteria bacterium]|nr:hypothetical protein [Betaproteobacteria bacterium]